MLEAQPVYVPVTQDDDYTVIPVQIKVDGQHSHDIEEGIFTNCQHVRVDKKGFCQNENCLEFVD